MCCASRVGSPYQHGSHLSATHGLFPSHERLPLSPLPPPPRAISIFEDAMARGLVPGFKLEEALEVDCRDMPPSLAEVYTLAVLAACERRYVLGRVIYNGVTFFTPAFDRDLVSWPSYVQKLNSHYSQPVCVCAAGVTGGGGEGNAGCVGDRGGGGHRQWACSSE